MSRKDRRWCWLFAFALMVVTSAPYLMAAHQAGGEWVFSGFLFGVEDGNSYIAKMLTGAAGAWLFRTPYTSAHQSGAAAFLPYLLLGKLVQPPAMHAKLVLLFHLFRVAAIPALVFALYRFAATFLPTSQSRRWVVALAAVGGGLGWVLPLLGMTTWLGSLPLEFYSPETFGFLAVLGLPHLILARALLLEALLRYLKAREEPAQGLLAGMLLVGVALLQPLTALLAFAVIGAHCLVLAGRASVERSWKPWLQWVRAAVSTAVLPLPLVGYLTFAFMRDPFLRAWTAQNRLPSPHWLHYVLAFGVLVPFLWRGVQILLRRREEDLILVSWAVLLPVLAYAPVTVQRRMPEAIWVALLTIAAVGIGGFAKERWLHRAGVALLLPSSLLLYAGSIQTAIHPASPAFLPQDQVESYTWLAENLPEGSVVLTSYRTGNSLPAYAPLRVVVGHGPESVNLDLLLPEVEAFYTGALDNPCAWLQEQDVDYVYDGPNEQEPERHDLSNYLCLNSLDEGEDAFIYGVVQP